LAYKQLGQFADSLNSYRTGHQLGSKEPNWPHPSAEWLRKAEQLVVLDAKLPKIMTGDIEPADAIERLGLAELCAIPCRQFYVVSARLYGEAFAGEPTLGDDLGAGNRYDAACAAALAGCGQGKDAAKLDSKEYARLRTQSVDWLRADLTAWRSESKKSPAKNRLVVEKMRHWQQDADFNGVRGDAALSELPEAESQAWRKLWEDVAALERRAAEAK
jgi:serine/threonine-protein kinase